MSQSTTNIKILRIGAAIRIILTLFWQLIFFCMQSYPVLICLGIFLIICVFFSVFVFLNLFGNRFTSSLFHIYYLVFYNLIFFFVIPVIFGKIFHKEKLKNLGLRMPENLIKASLLMCLALAILIPSIILISKGKQFHDFYTLAYNNATFYKTGLLLFTVLPLFYFSEEFFFRGFLLLNLSKKIGWHGLWITDILFVWSHACKPFAELLFAIPVGIILAFLTMATRSIYPSILVHYCIGLTVVILMTHW